MSCTICFFVQTVAVRFREGRMGNTYILAQVHQGSSKVRSQKHANDLADYLKRTGEIPH
jgi:hypothetical protein